VTIPPLFEDKQAYMEMLYKLLEAEEKFNNLNTEVVAKENVSFEFEESHSDVCCNITMRVPKTIEQNLTKNTIISVVIEIKRNPFNSHGVRNYYQGFGTVKKVLLNTDDDECLTVSLQIAVINPLDKSTAQTIPTRRVQYEKQLAFRIRVDNSMHEIHKDQIKKKLRAEEFKVEDEQNFIQ